MSTKKQKSEIKSELLPSIRAEVHVGENLGGQVTGVLIERMGYSVEQVQALIAQITAQFQAKPFSGVCPYVGLRSFQEKDANHFFGRERLISELIDLLGKLRMLVIAGPSGCGKSSLVRAGLLPALKRGALSDSSDWQYASFTPGASPLEALGRAVATLANSLQPLNELKSASLETPDLLAQWLEVLTGDNPTRRLVLLVDQFEEIFTQTTRQEDLSRQVFLDLLVHAVANENCRTLIILTMRSDFVAHCAAYPEFNAWLNQGFFQIGAMSAAELASAILRPALETGLQIDPALVNQVLVDMRDQPGALPLLQFSLTDLFGIQITQEKGTALTLDGYTRRGGLNQALERYADACYTSLEPGQQALAQKVFGALVVPGIDRQDTARTASFDDLTFSGCDPAEVEKVVRRLADARLVTTGEGDGASRTVRLAHERLLEAWPWLRRLVDDNRQAIVLQHEIQQDALRWQEARQDTSYLYSGARLATAQERLAQQQLNLTGLAEQFIAASAAHKQAQERAEREAWEAEQRREVQAAQKLAETQRMAAARLRRRAIILGVVLAAAVGLLVWAVAAQRQASQALGLSNARGTQVAQGAGTATHALGLSQARGTQAAQQQARAEGAESTAVYSADQALLQAERARAGELAASSRLAMQSDYPLGLLLALEALKIGDTPYPSAEGALREASLAAGGRYLDCGIEGKEVIFSQDGRRVVFGGDQGLCVYELQQWDAPLVKTNLVLRIKEENDIAYSVSADGRWLATNIDRRLNIIDLQENSQQAFGQDISEAFIALSPDGRWLALTDRYDLTLLDLRAPDGLASLDPYLGLYLYSGQAMRYIEFSPDGRWLVVAPASGQLKLFDMQSSDPYSSIRILGYQDSTIYGKPLAFSSNSTWLAASGTRPENSPGSIWDTSIYFWNLDILSQSNPGTQEIHDPAQILEGQRGKINDMAFNSSVSRLVSAGRDRQIHITNLEEIFQEDQINPAVPPSTNLLRGHDADVNSIAIDPSGRWVASSGADYSIKLWDLVSPITQDGIVLLKNPGWPYLNTVNFSPNGRWLAGVVMGKLVLWDLMQGDISIGRQIQGLIRSTYLAAWSEDWSWFATRIEGKRIVYWKRGVDDQPGTTANIDKPYSTLLDAGENMVTLTASRDGSELSGESWDPKTETFTSYHWDMTSENPPATMRAELAPMAESVIEEGQVTCDPDPESYCFWSLNRKWMIEGNYSKPQISIWDISGADPPVKVVYGDEENPTHIVGGSADDRWFAISRPDGTFLWDTNAGDYPTSTIRLSAISEFSSVSIVSSSDNHWLAILQENNVIILNLQNKSLVAKELKLSDITSPTTSDQSYLLAFSENSRWFFVSDKSSQQVLVWDLSTLNPYEMQLDGEYPPCLAGMSAGNRWFAIYHQEGIWLWDTNTGDFNNSAILLGKAPTAGAAIITPTRSSNRQKLAIWHENKIYLLDIHDEDLAIAKNHLAVITAPSTADESCQLSFRNDNQWLLLGKSRDLWLMPVGTAQNKSDQGFLINNANRTQFSPNERWLAVVTTANFLRLYELVVDGEVQEIKEYRYGIHPGGYDQIFFSPDEKWCASIDDEGKTIQLWRLDSPTGVRGPFSTEILLFDKRSFFYHPEMYFYPSGRWTVVRDSYGYDHLLLLPLAELAERACWSTGRNLTAGEWELNFPGEPYHKTCDEWP